MSTDGFYKLKKKTGISINDTGAIKQAFIHRSYLNESKETKQSNERLEFLGDSILSFLTSEHLYKIFPDFPEGELTNFRSSMVKTSTLAGISQRLELGDLLYLSKGEEDSGGRKNTSILADTFEAFLGAVFLDEGIEPVKKILDKYLFSLLPKIMEDRAYKDAKSDFQELVQEEIKISPLYKVIKETGPDHAKEFTVGVYVDNYLWGTGKGKSKQEAETEAAKTAIGKWNNKITRSVPDHQY
jgi:ribonuclease-3